MPVLAGDAFRVRVGVDLHDLRMPLEQPWPGGMQMQLAEAPAEGLLLLGGQVLVAKEQHAVLGERVTQRSDLRIVERLRQVEAENFRAAAGRGLAQIESGARHPGPPRARRRSRRPD